MAPTTLQHPTHDHPLVPLVSPPNCLNPSCELCRRSIWDEAYTCQECKSYYHRVCAEAPPQIDLHPLHPNHPLSLLHHRPPFRCDSCDEHFSSSGSSFRCDEYDFDLDIGCALSTLSDKGGSQGKIPKRITLPLHPHPLTSFSTRHDFVGLDECVICQKRVEGNGYMCLHHWCTFLIIHKRCIQDLYYVDGTKAPRVYHRHRLETFVEEEMGSRRCAYCGSDASREFVGCARCKLFIHRDCIQVPEVLQCPRDPDDSLVLFINDPNNYSVQCESCSSYLEGELCYGCINCNFFVHVKCALQTLAYCKDGMSFEIQWTWHEHPLLLCHRTKSDWGRCSCCGDESTGPMYACQKDSFLLHPQCIEIEPTIIHPHHPDHPLTLCRGADKRRLLCDACCGEIFGFNFSCTLCLFYHHVKCAARVPTQKHYLHEHELLHLDEVPSLDCNRCGTSTDSPLFRCVPCDFNLHKKCMELPRAVKHKTHEHPLTLLETYVEDDSGEYYCDLCEKRRDGRLGVYVCQRCTARWAFYMECVLPELQRVFAKKSKTSEVKRLTEQIAKQIEQVRAAEEKLEETKRVLDELMKEREELISRKEKNCVAAKEEGEPEKSL